MLVDHLRHLLPAEAEILDQSIQCRIPVLSVILQDILRLQDQGVDLLVGGKGVAVPVVYISPLIGYDLTLAPLTAQHHFLVLGAVGEIDIY